MYARASHVQGCQKIQMDPLEMELHMVVSYYVGSGNKIPILPKSNKCSQYWNHLWGPRYLNLFVRRETQKYFKAVYWMVI